MTARKAKFIHDLAQFLAGEQGAKSVLLELHGKNPPPRPYPNLVKEWAQLRTSSGLRGYPTVEEAEQHLREFLG